MGRGGLERFNKSTLGAQYNDCWRDIQCKSTSRSFIFPAKHAVVVNLKVGADADI
ncbi:Hypothetical predicted protein [Prunus dulcis]|uniref:Uncharacterized protein n=1 Tax=Prunus dulcis TaxID=3755 RepID=A0A5E4EGV3_PRUDU|nr:Hypothetical predicted protein [Prunus dulcis]